jgi:hypothetical protein
MAATRRKCLGFPTGPLKTERQRRLAGHLGAFSIAFGKRDGSQAFEFLWQTIAMVFYQERDWL